jgi:uncharacterized Tic20 family protein
MTSYASQPTPERSATGTASPQAEAPLPGDDEAPARGGQWQAGAEAPWDTGSQLWARNLRAQADTSPPADSGQPAEIGDTGDTGDTGDLAETSQPGDRRAVLSYLGVPFLLFLPPLAVYLITLRTSPLTRRHAAQALNLSITLVLYSICALILGGLLALDTVGVAVLIAVSLLAALWLVTLVYLVRAGIAASRGTFYAIPRWLCATLVR